MTLLLGDRRDVRVRWERRLWWTAYLAIIGAGMLVALFARRRIAQPYLGVSLALVAVILVGWLVLPRVTLYVTLALTAVSDLVTVSWFPFVKNLSSRESIAFVADAVTISPLDLTLVGGCLISVARRYARTRSLVAPNPMNRAVLVFGLFVLYGFVRGFMRGGDARIIVLIGRPMLYVVLAFVLVVNELTQPKHRRHAAIAIGIGVVAQSLLSIEYLSRLDPAVKEDLDSLNEHGSALGHNVVIVALVTFALLGIRHRRAKWALLAAVAPVGYVVFVAQRRAGIAALIVAAVATAMMLFWRHRRRFLVVVPVASVALAAYVAAFWSSSSSLGFPAQAVKTVIAPGSATYEDQSSDLYRMMEAYNLNFTIRAEPLFGLGFGQPFYRPIELPDISFFELNAYLPHNSILWVWIQFGYFGFVAMLFLLAKGILIGTENARHASLDSDFVALWISVTYILMFGVYTYVDVSWDARNTVFLGFAVAAVTIGRPTEDAPGRTSAPEPAIVRRGEPGESVHGLSRVRPPAR